MGDEGGTGPSRIDALDGVRAVAVVAVVLFHLDISWMSGGFLGVSLFFTLSGFLITRLLLGERAATGRVDLKRFWGRRLRRLSPASLVVLAAITVLALVGVYEGTRLRGDLASSLGYVANWRFATAQTTYAEMFTATPSPLIHFWSLAIEEQVYLLVPLVFVVLARRRRGLVIGLSVLTLASVTGSLFTDSRNLGYYGTHLRAAELLVGALLAVLLASRPRIGSVRGAGVLGGTAFVALIGLMVVAKPADTWLYRGGLAGVALLSVAIVLSASRDGVVARALSVRPAVAVGRASYSIYLVHWPLIVLMNPDRMGFDGWGLDVVRVAASFAVGWVVWRLIEDPVRTRRVLTGVSAPVALVVSIVGIAVAAAVVPSRPPMVLAGLDAPETVVDFSEDPTSQDTGAPTTLAQTPLPRVLVIGSQGQLGVDVANLGLDLDVVDHTIPGCVLLVVAMNGCPSIADVLADPATDSADVIFIGVGANERQLVGERVASKVLDPSADPGLTEIVETGLVANEVLDQFSRWPLVVVDYGEKDAFRFALEDFELRSDSTTLVAGGEQDRLQEIITGILSEVRRNLPRIMVIGDSTSFGVAQAIHNMASDRFDVVWAGGRNCPIVEVERIEWWSGMDFAMDYCPTFDRTWQPMFDDFRPQFVLLIASVPEQSGQRYPNDPAWHHIGDPEYAVRHEAAITRLMESLDDIGARLVIFDAPYVRTGALSGADFAADDRVEAWNALMDEWSVRWPGIARLGWTAILDRYETAEGPLREDGVHLSQENLDRIVSEAVVPELLRITEAPE
ncbi:MAG: acyltransferase family protein [Actinomycetota bacterium]